MIGFATTTVDIYRDADAGTTPGDVDEWGDEVETTTDANADTQPDPINAEPEPASLIEQTQKTPDPSTGDLRSVRAIIGRLRGDADVRSGDRIRDRRTGEWYSVDATRHPQNPAVLLDLVLELSRVS